MVGGRPEASKSDYITFQLGVSEGQFITVVREELPQVRDACNRVASGYKPTITYVIAGKR
jgi:eukaryotic translation initiation factor 2C